MARGKRNDNPTGRKSGKDIAGDQGEGLNPAPLKTSAAAEVKTEAPTKKKRGMNLGDNVTDEVMQDFERRWRAQRAIAKKEKDKLTELEAEGKGKGIVLTMFKAIQKEKDLSPAEAEAKHAIELRYRKQLGLFDAIAQYRQGVDNEDNEASVRQAEKANGTQKTGGAMDEKAAESLRIANQANATAYNEGEEFGKQGRNRDTNPYNTEQRSDLHASWNQGWDDAQAARALELGGGAAKAAETADATAQA